MTTSVSREDRTAELEWLRRTVESLRGTLRDADRRQIRGECLARWLQDIKDVACDAEDLIDELEYEDLRIQLEAGRGRARRSSLPLLSKAMALKMNELRRKLSDIADDSNRLLRIVGPNDWSTGDRTSERMAHTGSLLVETEVFGREKEKEQIIEYLLASSDGGRPSLIAITGMGGLGKTTLAQLVYSDRRVQEHFDLNMWVCMTADYINVVMLTREILGSTDYDMQRLWGVENLDVYQRKLVEKVRGKRFLLVIDNLWDRDERKWQTFRAPLVCGEEGSKILITTRDTRVATILQAREILELEGLEFHDCWMLFKRRAFPGANSREHPRLEAIGKQIVEKFRGVPLVATVIGGLLYSESKESEWMRILESEMWELEHGEDGILSVLKLSYEHLPPQLKQCFAYCSLFPKNHKFDKLELVQQWMAEGFLQAGGRRRILEDVGTEYLDDLFSRSFFQLVDGRFVMHDLIHDVALLISQRDHSVTDIDGAAGEGLEECQNLRRLSMSMPSRQLDNYKKHLIKKRLYRCKSLRTLVFGFPRNSNFQIPRGLFHSLSTLRVLDLSCGGIEMLPDSIGELRHLRYLDLRRNRFRRLPESLCCLYLLQTLKLEGCYNIGKLPQGISKLINLRHLEVEPHLLTAVVGIGKLTCLQELEWFPISDGRGIKIEDLKDMNELRGGISICNLDRVRSKEEAARAMLNNKRRLYRLEMEWGRCGNSNAEEVIEALVPPENLRELDITGYDGVRCPSWMENWHISMLESLCLGSCRNLNSLPPLWCLPYLKAVKIIDCPELGHLPSLPTTLRELTIHNVGLEELPGFYQPITHGVVGAGGDHVSPSLSILKIESCRALRTVQRGVLQYHLRDLTVLSIQDCVQLVHWPEGAGFQATLLSLRDELLIRGCPRLAAFPVGCTLSTSLKRLTLTGCPGAVNGPLFARLHNLPPESVVHVTKSYASFACCYQEALQNMRALDWLQVDQVEQLEIEELRREELWGPSSVALVYDTARLWSWRCDDWVVARRVRICSSSIFMMMPLLGYGRECSSPFVAPEEWWQRRSPTRRQMGCGTSSLLPDDLSISEFFRDCHSDKLISAFLGDGRFHRHLPWVPSLRWLVLVANGLWHRELPPLNLASLEGLWISCFWGAKPLLSKPLLRHLTGLRELQIFYCPKLTLSSLKQMIRSLPSLKHLTIEACPDLSSSPCRSHSSPTSASPSNAATLETLFLDDPDVLGDAQFVHDQLSSLLGLHVWYTSVTSFTAAAAEGMWSLGQSLRHLSIWSCWNLRHLPADLWCLLPSLGALGIGNCPGLRCLPEGRLPARLEILVIHCCPVLQGRKGQQHQQHKDWSKVAHIPVIVNNGDLVQGSYREFLELKAKWRGF